MRKLVLCLLCMGILIGCHKSESKFPLEISLKGKMLSMGDSLGMPFTIHVLNGNFIVRDDNGETCFTLIKSDLSFCYRFGQRGEGPNELIDPGPSFWDGNKFSVYDGAKMSLFTYSLDSLLQSKDAPVTSFKTEYEGNIIWLTNLSDSIYVATGAFSNDNRFCMLDSKGECIAELGQYDLKDEEKGLPFYIKGAAFQSVMSSQPDGNRFALATRYGGLLELYDYNSVDRSIQKMSGGIRLFVPRLTAADIRGSLNFVPDKDTRWGYLFLASDARYIYALYSGLYQREGEPFISGNTIHVFNWDGFPVCKLMLDKRVRDIAVDGDKLYGLYEDGEIGYDIIEYVLPLDFD